MYRYNCIVKGSGRDCVRHIYFLHVAVVVKTKLTYKNKGEISVCMFETKKQATFAVGCHIIVTSLMLIRHSSEI